VDRVSGAHETRALAAGLPRRSLAGEREAARDPGDEARPEALADCETCGAKVPARCTRRGDERMVYGVHVARARAAGLHVPDDDRAAVRPARDTVPTLAQLEAWREEGRQEERRHLERLGLIPKARKVVTVPQQARLVARRVWVALPWEQPMCPACKGARVVPGAAVVDGMAIACGVGCKACSGRGYRLAKLAPERSLEGMRVPREAIDVSVPIAYVARWGPTVRLYRREVTIPAHGVCWVYEAAQPQEGK
jgi:hypothetical protein